MRQRLKHDDLFPGIASFNALRVAARKAVLGKRKKPGASAFFANLERELLALERELRDGSYLPGSYVEILVRDPKERLVSAAPFRDRVVHHALCAVICPIFEPGFIGHTFANRTGKGTHAAIRVYERHRDNHAHVLRCDIYRYFPSIDHTILKALLRRRIACEATLALIDTIIDGSNAQEPVDLHFPGDDLFAPYQRRRGLPHDGQKEIARGLPRENYSGVDSRRGAALGDRKIRRSGLRWRAGRAGSPGGQERGGVAVLRRLQRRRWLARFSGRSSEFDVASCANLCSSVACGATPAASKHRELVHGFHLQPALHCHSEANAR